MLKRANISSLAPFRGRGKSRAGGDGRGGSLGAGRDAFQGHARFALLWPPLPNPSPPEGGEGLFGVSFPILAKRDQYCAGDAFGVGHDFAVTEAEHAESLAFYKGGAGGIIGFAPGMAVPIEFDYQPVFAGAEVGDIGGDWHLPDEFDAEAACAEDVPEPGFGRSHAGAQGFGASSGFDLAFQFDSPLSWASLRCAVPLPLKGERGVLSSYGKRTRTDAQTH